MLKDPCGYGELLEPDETRILKRLKKNGVNATAEEVFHAMKNRGSSLWEMKLKDPNAFERRMDAAHENRLEALSRLLHDVPVMQPFFRGLSRWLGLGPADPQFRAEMKNYEGLQREHDAFISRLEQFAKTTPAKEAERVFLALHYRTELAESDPLAETKRDIEHAFERYADTFVRSGMLSRKTVEQFQKEGAGYVPFTFPQQKAEMVGAWASRFFKTLGDLARGKAAAEQSKEPGGGRIHVPGVGVVGRHVVHAQGRFKERTIRDLREAIAKGLDTSARPIVAGVAQEGKAAAALEFLLRVAGKKEWTWKPKKNDAPPAGFIEVKGREFGPLNGKWIRKDIAGYVVDIAQPRKTGLTEALFALNALFKKWSVLGRPTSFVTGNILGNIFMSRMLTPFHRQPEYLKKAFEAIREYRKTKKAPQAIEDLGDLFTPLGARFLEDLGDVEETSIMRDVAGTGKEYAKNFAGRFLMLLEHESNRTPDGTISFAGVIRAVGNAVGSVDLSAGYLRRATGARDAVLSGQLAEEAWTLTDNLFKVANYMYLREHGSSDLFIGALRRAKGLAPNVPYEKDVALQKIRDLWDLRAVPKVIRDWRRAPLGYAFVTYPYIATRQLLFKGEVFRNPVGSFFWLMPAALMHAAYQAITGDDDDEVKKNQLLAAGGNESLARLLTPIFKDADGRVWHWNVAGAGAADLVRGVLAPTGGMMETGAGNDLMRWLFSSNPMMSTALRTAGWSPYTGRPDPDYRWWNMMLAASPAGGIQDLVRKEAWAAEDEAKGLPPLRTDTERALEWGGLKTATSAPPGTPSFRRQEKRANRRLAEQEFYSEGGRSMDIRVPEKPDAEDETLMERYRRLRSRTSIGGMS